MDQNEEMPLHRNGLMCGISSKTRGISLIEVLVAISLLVLLATLFVPRLQKPKAHTLSLFFRQLNALVRTAWREAVITQTTQKITFDFQQRYAMLSQETPKHHTPLKRKYARTRVEWPTTVEIKNLVIDKTDEKKQLAARKTKHAWFFLFPDGSPQEVTINMIDTKNEQKMSGVLNPFSVTFDTYDTFQQ